MSASDYTPLPIQPNPAGTGSPTIVSATAPAVKELGTTWLNTTNNVLSVWDGAAWVVTSSTSTSTALPNANKHGDLLIANRKLVWQPNNQLDMGRYP